MGSDKAIIDFGGSPLWRRQVQLLESLCPAEILISGPLRGPWGSEYRIIEDTVSEAGPLAGICAVLAAASHGVVLTLAVDMPLMTADYMSRLIYLSTAECGIIPKDSDGFEPLAAIYTSHCTDIGFDFLGAGNLSVRAFARALSNVGLVRPVEIQPEETLLFSNINSPEDISKLAART